MMSHTNPILVTFIQLDILQLGRHDRSAASETGRRAAIPDAAQQVPAGSALGTSSTIDSDEGRRIAGGMRQLEQLTGYNSQLAVCYALQVREGVPQRWCLTRHTFPKASSRASAAVLGMLPLPDTFMSNPVLIPFASAQRSLILIVTGCSRLPASRL